MLKKMILLSFFTMISIVASEPINVAPWDNIIQRLASEAVEIYYQLLPEAYSCDAESGTLTLYRKGSAYKSLEKKEFGQYENYSVQGPQIDLPKDILTALNALEHATKKQKKLILTIAGNPKTLSSKKKKLVEAFKSPALSAYLIHLANKETE